MEGKVRVRLLGSPQTVMGDEAVKFPYRKTEGIFYYICINKKVTRDELVSMFWADSDEKAGRKSVRQVLYQLKKCLGDDILITEGHSTIELNPDRAVEIDWNLPEDEFLHREGEFLHCFYIKDCPEMDAWIQEIRDKQRERCRVEVQRQLAAAEKERDVRTLQRLIRMWINLEPLTEEVVQEAMDSYARMGQYNLAVQTFYEYRDRLMDELEEEPGDRIMQSFQRIFNMKEAIEDNGSSNTEQAVFLERFDELFRINEEIQHFASGQPYQSIVITGSMGVGKTSLLEHVQNKYRHENFLTLYALVSQADTNFYLRSWCEILRGLEQYEEKGIVSLTDVERSTINQLLRGNTGEAEGTGLVNVSAYPVLENIVTGMLHRIGEDLRILLYLDDIQWMDQISSQMLLRVLQESGHGQVLLLATCRNTETDAEDMLFRLKHRKNVSEMPLKSFTREETEHILQQHFAGTAPITVDELYRRTEGNALIMMDLLDVIKEEGAVPENLPDRTGQALAPFLRNLTEDEQQMIRVLSIFMESAEIPEIQVLMPRSPLELYEILESLQRKHLVKEIDQGHNLVYQLRHRAYHDYIYQSQSLGKRRIWHQMVAEYYEKRQGKENWFEVLPYLIYQLEKSGDQKKADQYRVQYYCEFYALSNENFPVLQTRMVYDELSLGSRENEKSMLELAERLTKDPLMAGNLVSGECCFLMGRNAIAHGNYEDGLKNIRSAIYIAEQLNNSELLLACYRQMIFYGVQVDDREVMKEYCESGLEYLSTVPPGSDHATFLRLKGLYLYRCNQLDEAEETLNQSIRILASLRSEECQYQLSRAADYNYLGKCQLKRARKTNDPTDRMVYLDEAEKLFRQAIEVGVNRYVTNGMGQFRANLGQTLMEKGNLKDAEQYLREAIDCFRTTGFIWGWDRAEAYLCMVCLRLGLKQEAKEHLALAEQMIPQLRNPGNMELLEVCRNMM